MRRPVSYEAEKAPEGNGCCVGLIRWTLAALNMLILLLGIAVIVVVIIAATNDNDSRGKQIYENCTICRNVMISSAIIFGFVIFSSLCGFIALCTRKSCLLVCYAFFGFLMMLLMGACTAGIVLMKEGRFADGLQNDWEHIEAAGRCKLQTTFECSGWEDLCHPQDYNVSTSASTTPMTSPYVTITTTDSVSTTVTNANVTVATLTETSVLPTMDTTTGATPTTKAASTTSPQPSTTAVTSAAPLEDIPTGCADCGPVDNLLIGNYTETCRQKLQSTFNDTFIPLISISATFTAICFVVIVVACRLKSDSKKKEEDVALLNEHYV